MPIYTYRCPSCSSEFDELLALEDYSPLRVCPDCNAPSPRKITAAQLQMIKNSERIAKDRNERAIYEPIKVTRKHQCDSSCNHDQQESKKGVFKQISAGSRPWMLG